MSELDYPAQKYFPENCIECPTLYGMIEDGDLLGSMTEAFYRQVISGNNIKHEDIKNCPGPLDEGDGWSSCTMFSLINLLETK